MKVILLQDVKGQGKKGQLIDVSDGYARNFLLPRKLAQEATADNINTMKMNDKALQEKRQKEREQAVALAAQLKEMTLVVTAKGGGAGRLFGSVTNAEVAEALAAEHAGMTMDAVGVCIDEAIAALMELTGRQVTDAVVEEVFASFCVGK